jgi:hypothetical protein
MLKTIQTMVLAAGFGILALGFTSARAELDGPSHPNAISVEALGRGMYWSVNFDRMMSDNFAIGVGFSYATASGGSSAVIPIYLNWYLSTGDSRPYLTGGFDVLVPTPTVSFLSSTTTALGSFAGVVGAGYEYRGPTGFLFRVAPYVFVGSAIVPWVGVSFGYAF